MKPAHVASSSSSFAFVEILLFINPAGDRFGKFGRVDAASLGLAICDCKERQVCQLTYAPNTIGKLHSFFKSQICAYLRLLKRWTKARITRITATTSKTSIAALSAAILILVFSVSVSKSVRFFCAEHPGILLVVLAVAGEVVCDWNRKKTSKIGLKKPLDSSWSLD